jgi:hypothetical protein
MSNWKFWTWPAQLRAASELEKNLNAARERAAMWEKQAANMTQDRNHLSSLLNAAHIENHTLGEEIERWTAWKARMALVGVENRAEVKKKIQEALAGLGEQHPVWVALNTLLVVHLAVEHRAAKQYGPGADAALRDFNSGREAGLEDFRAALWKLHHEARKTDT